MGNTLDFRSFGVAQDRFSILDFGFHRSRFMAWDHPPFPKGDQTFCSLIPVSSHEDVAHEQFYKGEVRSMRSIFYDVVRH